MALNTASWWRGVRSYLRWPWIMGAIGGVGTVAGAFASVLQIIPSPADLTPVLWGQLKVFADEKVAIIRTVVDQQTIDLIDNRLESLATRRVVLIGQLTAYAMRLRDQPEDAIALEAKLDREKALKDVDADIDAARCRLRILRQEVLLCAP